MTTVHANSAVDALRRHENLVLMGGFELPSRAIRELLGATIHLVVQTSRFADGARRVTSIGEVGWSGEELASIELFRFEAGKSGTGIGRHRATGVTTRFLERLQRVGWRPVSAAQGGPGG